MKNGNSDNGAFPRAHLETVGLTKREYFAGLAMQGMIANNGLHLMYYDAAAKDAVKHADALLKALAETEVKGE